MFIITNDKLKKVEIMKKNCTPINNSPKPNKNNKTAN